MAQPFWLHLPQQQKKVQCEQSGGQPYFPLGFTSVRKLLTQIFGLVYKATYFLSFVKYFAFSILPFPLTLICCWGNVQFTNHIIIKILLSPSTNLVNHTCNLILNQEVLEPDSWDSLNGFCYASYQNELDVVSCPCLLPCHHYEPKIKHYLVFVFQ